MRFFCETAVFDLLQGSEFPTKSVDYRAIYFDYLRLWVGRDAHEAARGAMLRKAHKHGRVSGRAARPERCREAVGETSKGVARTERGDGRRGRRKRKGTAKEETPSGMRYPERGSCCRALVRSCGFGEGERSLEAAGACATFRDSSAQWPLNMRRPVLIDERVVAPPITSSRKLM